MLVYLQLSPAAKETIGKTQNKVFLVALHAKIFLPADK